MLSKLFGSEARVKILNIFLTKPDGNYYLRQLARDLDLQVNSVRRELLNLETLGLIIQITGAIKDKEKKYYTVNRDFLLFDEIKSLFIKAQMLSTKEFSENVQKICTPKLLILTGFFTGESDSKTDILIVGKINKDKLLKLIRELENSINREINYTIMDEKEFIYRKEIFDVFLHKIMEGKKLVISDSLSSPK
ncbi:MAG: winged helix-turn-helix domain-containing protein [Candidatus Falkowbacteria bacterium]